MRKKIKLLEYETEISLDFLHFCLAGVKYLSGMTCDSRFFIEIDNFTAVDFFKEGSTAKKRRFAASGRTDDADNLTVSYG